ncbi:Tim44/TimA family putative adaptor protein [Halocynthiibacter namhaensis]|uniref:Tim44/TimA family putative adaptor protein n=1 Tax=Halocynthiibacter namhaensis TaxID=1290553 RepID=UPI000579687A|nr:Tim44/TimA family putative adaptor protein [Halocynthiibacter namhaensis]
MNDSSSLQLLVLAGVAIFLFLKLRSVLGTREGFEKPPMPRPDTSRQVEHNFEVIEGGPDRDITDHVEENSPEANTLAAMKAADPSFSVTEFIGGARGAYEMILMGFERGDLGQIKPFLAPDVYETFAEVVTDRELKGLTIEADFIGIREIAIAGAEFNSTTRVGEISVRVIGELTSVVRDRGGDIIEGDKTTVKRQRDTWTFAHEMGSENPNWKLVATGE